MVIYHVYDWLQRACFEQQPTFDLRHQNYNMTTSRRWAPATRLCSHISIFGVVFFVLKSLARQRSGEELQFSPQSLRFMLEL